MLGRWRRISEMKLGEVFRFSSDQAVGHAARRKIHIFLTKTDHHRAPAENVFLFISSGDYGGCFPIRKADYGNILDHDSFVSCGNLVFYTDEYLSAKAGETVGQIARSHLKSLHGHLVDHDTMPFWQIQIACGALAAAL
jgi:hypothetical protein